MKRLILILLAILLLLSGALTAFAHHPDTIAINKEQVLEMLDSPDLIILDVRLIGDYEESPIQIKGAQRTTLSTLDDWVRTVPNTKTIVVYCNSANNSHSTSIAYKLQNLGFKHVYYLEGGWEGWLKAGHPIEKK